LIISPFKLNFFDRVRPDFLYDRSTFYLTFYLMFYLMFYLCFLHAAFYGILTFSSLLKAHFPFVIPHCSALFNPSEVPLGLHRIIFPGISGYRIFRCFYVFFII